MANPLQKNQRSAGESLIEQVLAQSQSSREVIQDFVPLAQSLEWDLGQEYLRQRGNKAFISDSSPIPFVINNDGTLSRHAAEVFLASLDEAEKAGTMPKEIYVLELGIGVGLFARFFLDQVQALCHTRKKDYYQRLTYIAADRSARMLTDLLRHGILANHPGRFRVRQVDALQPGARLPFDVGLTSSLAGERGVHAKPLHAVFLNYLLDCLPCAVLQFESDKVRQLYVRTCLARSIRLSDHTDLTAEQLRQRAKANDARSRQELLEVYGLFSSEYDYQPVEIKDIPYGEFAAEFARRGSKNLLHSYGAIRCLEKLLGLISEDGFILFNEYGQTQVSSDQDFEHQRFSLATAVGINFPLLDAYFGESKQCAIIRAGDNRGIHSRLYSKKHGSNAIVQYYQSFGDGEDKRLQEPIQQARGYAKVGKFAAAFSYYEKALHLQLGNWVLLNEMSLFLTYQMRDPKAGANLAKIALGLNPTCSADLWNTLGDALYEWGRTTEARGVYEKALTINAADVRSRYNLAWVHARERNYDAALKRISEAFALDKTGEYRDRLMQKLQEVLQHVALKHQQEYLLLINLVSRYTKPKDDTEPPPQPGDKQD